MEIFTAIAIAFALIGILLAWYGVHRHRKHGARHARAVASWQKTSATVIDARLVDRETSDSDGDTTTWYEPRLRYRYAVGDRMLEGNKTALCAARRFSLFEPAQKWLLAHAPGTEIELWYDPAAPEDSAPLLDRPSVLGTAILVVVGLGFVVAAGALLAGLA